jgi:hypothetical protein
VIPISSTTTSRGARHGDPVKVTRRIGQVSHVQYRSRGKGDWAAYTVTQTGGAGSYGQSGIMLDWLKKHTRRERPNLRVVTADDVLGKQKR